MIFNIKNISNLSSRAEVSENITQEVKINASSRVYNNILINLRRLLFFITKTKNYETKRITQRNKLTWSKVQSS